MGASPYKMRHFAIGAFNLGKAFEEENNESGDPHDHGLGDVINCSLTPESQPVDEQERLLQLSLLARAQRYDFMSCIPIGVMLRILHEHYMVKELEEVKNFYRDHKFDVPMY